MTPPVEPFLYREAAYLDTGRLSVWLALFSEDATYWVVPNTHDLNRNAGRDVCLVRDDHQRLAERVSRLEGGRAPSASASVATMHLIGNVLLERSPDGLLVCSSNQVIHYSQAGQTGTVPVWVEHRLRLDNGHGFLIVRKKAIPLCTSYLLGNMGFLV